jgi:hypothetical protein
MAEAVTAAKLRAAAMPFRPACKFEASVGGMVSRTGTEGLGYYPDVAAVTTALLHRELYPLAGITPANLRLGELVPLPAGKSELSNARQRDDREPSLPEDRCPTTLNQPRKALTPAATGPRPCRAKSRGLRRTPHRA